jgi:hypothetical protein
LNSGWNPNQSMPAETRARIFGNPDLFGGRVLEIRLTGGHRAQVANHFLNCC